MNYTYDYTKTMMMKILMAEPDRLGDSHVYVDVEKALDIIKQVDNMTLGTSKIVYLVGWQYLGHDDKYPAFFEVNEGIKKEGFTAQESLIWLINEAKKYNTVVSLHINFADAYEDSPLFEEYVKHNALIRNRKGKPAKIEKYNGKACYKISYKEEWESGLFKKRIDKLFELLPIAEIGTVHVDNFQCYVNRAPYISAEEMKYYRNKMIDYLREKGVDITSEFTYREGKRNIIAYGKITRDITPYRYPIACLNKIPAVWWTDKMTIEEYYMYYPHIYGGGIPKNVKAYNLFYGNIHGEDLFRKDNWQSEFIRYFISVNIPFFYLNEKTRIGFADKSMCKVKYDDGTTTSVDGVITAKDGKVVRRGKLKVTNMGKLSMANCEIFLPYKDGYVFFSDEGGTVCYNIEKENGNILYEITPQGLKKLSDKVMTGDKVTFIAQAGKAYYIGN